MFIPLRLPVLALSLVAPAFAAIVHLDDPASGSYLNQQGFTYDTTSITWAAGLPVGSGFFVQSFDDFGDTFIDFGQWNDAPFALTTTQLTPGASVKNAPLYQGQLHLSSFGATFADRYYGIRYDTGGGYQYGWLNLSTGPSGALIHGIAFNTVTGDDILAGQTAIPEPASYAAALSLFASAVVIGRRRRTSATSR
ncbi:MAG: hypothetical protein MUE42_01315 [Opitutaceae bacterium]|nr:hypothetical protein [Opitutaceae bacterium]